jgi:hypothetical protein
LTMVRAMKLQHLSTERDCFGVFDVCVRVDSKKDYTFSLPSEYAMEEFLRLLCYHPGKALNYLKKFAIK